MTVKQFVEEMTDQRIPNDPHHYKILQHSLYVKLLPAKKGKVKIIIINTPY